jgi:NAD(P)H dehydrogenase (quinone)
MKVLSVFCHPRRDSLTGAALDAFAAGLAEAGHVCEIADLYAEGFDPVLQPPDEPDWSDGNKRYSDAVMAEMARIERNDAIALVFPVWWWSMPAMLKGWIDRVWNNGWAYGDRNLAGRRGVALCVAGTDQAGFQKRGYDRAFDTQIRIGIFDYCGVPDAAVHMLYGSILGDPAVTAGIVEESRRLGRAFR